MRYSTVTRELLEIANRYGYTTARDFSLFLNQYASSVFMTKAGRQIIQPTLF